MRRSPELGATSVEPVLGDDDGSSFALAVRRRDEVVDHLDDSAEASALDFLGWTGGLTRNLGQGA